MVIKSLSSLHELYETLKYWKFLWKGTSDIEKIWGKTSRIVVNLPVCKSCEGQTLEPRFVNFEEGYMTFLVNTDFANGIS